MQKQIDSMFAVIGLCEDMNEIEAMYNQLLVIHEKLETRQFLHSNSAWKNYISHEIRKVNLDICITLTVLAFYKNF